MRLTFFHAIGPRLAMDGTPLIDHEDHCTELDSKVLGLWISRVGSKAPTIREAASLLRVPTTTVYRALQRLTAEGLIKHRYGRWRGYVVVKHCGTFTVAPLLDGADATMNHACPPPNVRPNPPRSS